jgi:hypothetical protein
MKKLKLLACLTFFLTITAGNYWKYNHASNPPIIVSTICGDLNKVKKECTPTNINTQNSQGQTALMHSCIHGSGDIFIFLIENNADINFKDNSGKTALDYAIEHNRAEMIEFLLLSGADDNLSLTEALRKAAKIQKINMLKQILLDAATVACTAALIYIWHDRFNKCEAAFNTSVCTTLNEGFISCSKLIANQLNDLDTKLAI